jgi:single-stranded DNA-binding protein
MQEEQLINTNNKVTLSGIISETPKFSHELYGEKFYEFKLDVARLSEFKDKLPITISEKLLSENNLEVGNSLTIKGQLRSRNEIENQRSKLILSVFARELLPFDASETANEIFVIGTICKNPIYRTTPFNREICDILVAVNRSYNKSDYLPAIAWGKNARLAEGSKIGDKVEIVGRIQSREYQKKISETEIETRVAYEISINKIENLSVKKDIESPTQLA